ncbi:MAG: DUF3098 domain-containing protein [Bacteroidales bacterium]|nr:DUF3098 domain-containing protein [Bacteroidales bacterium]MDD4684608.1 DUF3098 domain-containing protein [Bacteroidales bacterium]
MATQKKVVTKVKTSSESYPLKPSFDFAFERINYIWMLIGIVLLALGYILLIGGGSNDPDVFNESLFDAQRLTVAPILMVLGIAVEVYAILLKPKNKADKDIQE